MDNQECTRETTLQYIILIFRCEFVARRMYDIGSSHAIINICIVLCYVSCDSEKIQNKTIFRLKYYRKIWFHYNETEFDS